MVVIPIYLNPTFCYIVHRSLWEGLDADTFFFFLGGGVQSLGSGQQLRSPVGAL